MRTAWNVAAAITLAVVAACSSPPVSPPLAAPEIRLTESASGAGALAVSVVGLPPDDLAALRSASGAAGDWGSMLRVSVDPGSDGDDLPPVAGSYGVVDGSLRFVPAFPLDPRVAHRVWFDPGRLPRRTENATESWRSRPIELAIPPSRQEGPPTTTVRQVFPPSVLLENQLRIYVQFTAPMGTRRAHEFVRLLDEDGQIVEDAFLPLDVSLWNADHTRYTLLFDPGRVKRGILPNQEMGRPLVAGRRYTLLIDRQWRDAQDRPLAEEFRRQFQVGPAVLEPIAPNRWRLDAPAAGTRDPLLVTFPRPLDHANVEKSLFVLEPHGRAIEGTIAVNDEATRWTFTPRDAWMSGGYQLGTLAVLEDPAGNRVGRAFDFDPGQGGSVAEDGSDTHAQALVPFTVSPN